MRKTVVFAIFCIVISVAGQVPQAWSEGPKIDMQALAAKQMPVLLEFGRGWCIPCKYMKPILEDLSRAYTGRAVVTTVDMDANKKLVRDFGIRMMPTQVFVTADGKEFFRNEGTIEREQIIDVFSKMGVVPPAQVRAPISMPEPVAR